MVHDVGCNNIHHLQIYIARIPPLVSISIVCEIIVMKGALAHCAITICTLCYWIGERKAAWVCLWLVYACISSIVIPVSRAPLSSHSGLSITKISIFHFDSGGHYFLLTHYRALSKERSFFLYARFYSVRLASLFTLKTKWKLCSLHI